MYDVLKLKVMKFETVVHSRNTTVHFSLVNTPSVCLKSFIPAKRRTKMQHPLREEQHKERFTQKRSCRRLHEKTLFSASPSRLIESDSSEPGFVSGLCALRSQNASRLPSLLAASSHHGTPLSPLLREFVRETGHKPIISLIAVHLSDVIAERDCHSQEF